MSRQSLLPVNPGCGYTLLNFCDDIILELIIHLNPHVLFEVNCYEWWRMNHWQKVEVYCNLLLHLKLPDAIN